MTDTATLYGRDRELARLDLAIGSGTDGMRFARIHGAAGIGKTTLAAHAAELAALRGFEVTHVRGRAGSLGSPMAPLAEVFTVLHEHIVVQRVAGHSIDVADAAALVREVLAGRAATHPQLLVIDDAQALDASSVALLDALLAFDEDPNITIVLIEQTDDPAVAVSFATFRDELLAGHSVLQIEPPALADASIAAIVADALGVDPDAVPEVIVERASGNPWFARELSAAWIAGDHDVPRNIAAAAVARLNALPGAAREFVQLCAGTPSGVRTDWLDTLASDRSTIAAMHGSGLVVVEDGVAAVHHPLMRAAIAECTPIALHRVLHRELAAVIAADVAGSDASALRAAGFHLAVGGRPFDAAHAYREAARRNDEAGFPHEAYADLAAALDCETRVDGRIELLRSCARAATILGTRDAVTHWNELIRTAAAIHDDELYAYALVQQYWASHDGTSTDRLSRAANLGSDRVGWSARAAATLARLDGRLQDAIEHDTAAIRVARERGDAELEVLALEKLASSHALLGNTRDAIGTCRTAIERARTERFHESAALTWGCLVETLTEELAHEEALAEARAADDYLVSLGLTRKRPALLAWQTSVLIRMGELDAATRVAMQAVELDAAFRGDASYRAEHFGALVALLRADVANESGDPAALQFVERAAERIRELGYHSWQLEVDFERARAVARRDGVDAALMYVADVEASGEPAFVASVARWLARVAVISGSASALERVRELRAVEYVWIGTPVLALTRLEIDATLRCIDEGLDVDELRDVANRWRSAGRVLDALRIEQSVGALLLRRGDVIAARVSLRATFAELSRRNATGDTDQVAALLRSAGSRTRAAIRRSEVGSLTQRELEVARLAARGARNREIASSLFITETTVTAHLTRVYDKTGVRSRIALADWLLQRSGTDGGGRTIGRSGETPTPAHAFRTALVTAESA